MSTLRTDASDGDLVERTRGGDRTAYAELWQRHSESARTVARSWSSLDPDDLVAESFTRIYDAILTGGGPNGAFRPYLFTTIRNTAASWGRARQETSLDTLESFEDPATGDAAALDALDRSTTAQAFRALPTRWQEVLWYSEVEGMSPQQIAPLVGMSANAASALAYRAREGLRQAWIQAHLKNPANEPECRWTIGRLGAYTRGRLRSRDTARLEAHLDGCQRCTIVAAEAREAGSRLALVLLPLAAGIGGAAAYSAWLSNGAPVAHAALGLGGSAAGGGAGGGAATSGGAGGASGAGAASSAGAASAAGSAGGIAIGAGVGALVLAGVAVAVAMVLPTLTTPDPPVGSDFVVGDASGPGDTGPSAPVLPIPMPPTPLDERPEARNPEPAPRPPAPPVPTAPIAAVERPTTSEPAPMAEAVPTVERVDVIPLPPTFTADTTGGLVDPILTGAAEPGATIVVTGGGLTWSAIADDSGAWSLVARGLPAGATELIARQTDAAGNTSDEAAVGVHLESPTLSLRQSSHHTWHTTIGGVAGSTVQLLLDGSPAATLVLDGAGTTRQVLVGVPPTPSFGVRYAIGDRTGPVATATG